jgi:hypothetical protein
VLDVQVKTPHPTSAWVWGAFKAPLAVMLRLEQLWEERERRDQYLGTLVNQYLAEEGRVVGIKAGVSYVDVGTLHGYREALSLLQGPPRPRLVEERTRTEP